METTLALLRRQGRLLTALLDQAEDAVADEDWSRADADLTALGERLQQRIRLAEGSVLPWIERRIGEANFLPVTRLILQHAELVGRMEAALARVREQRGDEAGPALGWLRALLEAHLREEEGVLWPVVAAESPP
jgi:hypothetical protein